MFTEIEKKTIAVFFYVKEMHDNYAVVRWRRKEYVIAPIGDSTEYACTSVDVLVTGKSFSEIRDQLDES